MRIYTVLPSVVVHTIAVGFIVIAPIVATDELPEPRRATEFIVVQPVTPPQPQRPADIAQPSPRSSRDAAPVEEPDSIEPEPIADLSVDRPAKAGGHVQEKGRVREGPPVNCECANCES
jgi:hypothetical protein